MISALGIINSARFLERPLRKWMDEQAAVAGVKLDWRVVNASNRGDYKPWFRSCTNIISWGFKMPHRWMTQRGQNVLFIENSLIRQDQGIFADHRGWFGNSNLRHSKEVADSSHIDLAHLAKDWFGWKLGSGGNPRGPILVCLQRARDASMRQYFPLGKGVAPDALTNRVLELLKDHLPPVIPILIRPHPLDRANFTPAVWRDDWRTDLEGSLSERLAECSAMVTVNSTCATEASLLGIPVATLGVAGFTGHGVTLECHESPAKLAELSHWRPRWQDCEKYVRAVLGGHFMSYERPEEWPCPEWCSWLETARQSEANEEQKYRALYASCELPRYGHSNHGRAALGIVLGWQPESLIDVGCGFNEFVKSFRGASEVRAVGVDFACPGADVNASASSLPFQDAEFDVLTAFDVLEHIIPGDVTKVLAEMARVSRRFVFAICYGPGKARWKGQTLHPTIRDENWWIDQIEKVGGTDVCVNGRFITGRWARPSKNASR